MARGDKSKYTSKQKRQAAHIEESAESSGKSKKRAQAIAWATVNNETGGAGKKVSNTEPSKKGGRKGGRKKATKKTTRKTSSKKTSKKKATSRKKK